MRCQCSINLLAELIGPVHPADDIDGVAILAAGFRGDNIANKNMSKYYLHALHFILLISLFH